jgi:SNF2 family DNA or RNA helicase
VYVYDIVAEDTIDEVVLKRHETKQGVQDLLLEAVKARKHV